jgi:hypothetical protein
MSKTIEIEGTVEKVLPTQDFPSGFRKRILVINDGDDKYPQSIPVEFTKDKCDALDSLILGQRVKAFVNLRGNEYNGKYYPTIQGWKIEKGEGETSARPEPRNLSVPSNRHDAEDLDEDGDIPF